MIFTIFSSPFLLYMWLFVQSKRYTAELSFFFLLFHKNPNTYININNLQKSIISDKVFWLPIGLCDLWIHTNSGDVLILEDDHRFCSIALWVVRNRRQNKICDFNLVCNMYCHMFSIGILWQMTMIVKLMHVKFEKSSMLVNTWIKSYVIYSLSY